MKPIVLLSKYTLIDGVRPSSYGIDGLHFRSLYLMVEEMTGVDHEYRICNDYDMFYDHDFNYYALPDQLCFTINRS